MTLPGTIYKTDNSQTYVAATGQNIDITGDGATFYNLMTILPFNTAGVVLGGDVVISTGAGTGNVDFSSTLTGSYDLDISSGSGNVIITGNID